MTSAGFLGGQPARLHTGDCLEFSADGDLIQISDAIVERLLQSATVVVGYAELIGEEISEPSRAHQEDLTAYLERLTLAAKRIAETSRELRIVLDPHLSERNETLARREHSLTA
jgi:hypothetical protein